MRECLMQLVPGVAVVQGCIAVEGPGSRAEKHRSARSDCLATAWWNMALWEGALAAVPYLCGEGHGVKCISVLISSSIDKAMYARSVITTLYCG